MRIGDLEIPGGLLVMPAFVVVIALLVLWTWYYYSKQKSEMQSLAASRSWKFLGKDSPELRLWFEEVDAHRDWRPNNIILVEGPPDRVYLFNYHATTNSSDDSELGTACLAERPDGQSRELVIIDRLGILDNLLDDNLEVGGPEFRGKFRVRSRRPDIAAATVTSGVQEVLQELLLRRTHGLKWDRVWIAGRRVLVTVTLRLKPEEWDELLDISKRLLAALP